MAKARNLVKQLFLLLLIPVLAAVYFAGPSTASAAPRTAHFASAATHHPKKPCGIKHYPRCPHGHIGGQKHHHAKQGHRYHLHAQHFPKHKKITVHIKGHGHDKLIFRSHTNKHGNKFFSVKIPKNFKPGKYTLIVKVGNTTKKIHIHVKRAKKHHHHGHH
ncbi:MAG TPA: hypothetical protein VGH30_06920 [Jatrophihabitantaceae bacterium]|jgi:hypothetical protein